MLVLERDGYTCAGCGTPIIGRAHSVQPRAAHGMGRAPQRDAGSLAGWILLCGSTTRWDGCHGACEKRDPVMHTRGLWLWPSEDPALVPILRHGGSGPEWLLPDGKITFEDPAEGP
jgi:hypothetical protein